MINLAPAERFPLFVALDSLSSDAVVRADIIKIKPDYHMFAEGIELSYISESPGHYHNTSIIAPSAGLFQVNYFVYEQDEYGQLSLFGSAMQVFSVSSAFTDQFLYDFVGHVHETETISAQIHDLSNYIGEVLADDLSGQFVDEIELQGFIKDKEVRGVIST